MVRIARIIGVGYPHHITQRGNNRQKIFGDDKDRIFYLKLLKKYSLENNCCIHAFCLMSNHIHLLVVPEKEESLAKLMQKVSLVYTQYSNKKYMRTGRLWECRFHSSLVEKESYLLAVCRYIEMNPVRANIVKSPQQYKWSSVKINIGLKNLEKTFDFVEPIWENYFDQKEYRNFLLEKSDKENELIRKAVRSGRPLGEDQFIEVLSEKLGFVINQRKQGRPKNEK